MNEKEKSSANETEEIPEATAPPDELQPDVEDDPAVKDVPETTEQAIDPPSESQPREKKKHFMLLDFNILNPLLTRNENDCHIIAVDASDDDDDKDNDNELPPLVDKPPLGSATRPLLTFPPRSKDNYRNIRGISPPLFCTSSRPAPQPEIPDFLFQVIRQPQIKPEFDKFLMTAINQLQQKEKIDSSEELNKFVLNKEKREKLKKIMDPLDYKDDYTSDYEEEDLVETKTNPKPKIPETKTQASNPEEGNRLLELLSKAEDKITTLQVAAKLQLVYNNLLTQDSMTSPGMIKTLGGPMKLIDEAIKMCGQENTAPPDFQIPESEDKRTPYEKGLLWVNSRMDFIQYPPPEPEPEMEPTAIIELFNKLNMKETSLVDCSFCKMLHAGPHCYEGGCSSVIAISKAHTGPSLTRSVCNNCKRRHEEGEPLDMVSTTGGYCRYCQRPHDYPMCRTGTCNNLGLEPFICPVKHEIKNCQNTDCLLSRVDYSTYLLNTPTLHKCFQCGARHLNEKQKKLGNVSCGYCHTRHKPPHCSVGDCKNASTIKTSLTSPDGFPVQSPAQCSRCNCGRRHILQTIYKNLRNPFIEIYCNACTEVHEPPLCSRGDCGMERIIYPILTNINKMFICQNCNDRHLEAPQKFKKPPIFNTLFDCEVCKCVHGPGICIRAKTCEEAIEMATSDVRIPTATRLRCTKCKLRHLGQHVLKNPYMVKDERNRRNYCTPYNPPTYYNSHQPPMQMMRNVKPFPPCRSSAPVLTATASGSGSGSTSSDSGSAQQAVPAKTRKERRAEEKQQKQQAAFAKHNNGNNLIKIARLTSEDIYDTTGTASNNQDQNKIYKDLSNQQNPARLSETTLGSMLQSDKI